jgi:hypothetical protein
MNHAPLVNGLLIGLLAGTPAAAFETSGDGTRIGAHLAAAQTVTAADIQRLQEDIYQASSDLTRMRGETSVISQLRDELDEVRDEVTYLKVKLRKEGSVSRSEYNGVRDRIQALRSRTRGEEPVQQGAWRGGTTPPRGDTAPANRPETRTESSSSAIPVGHEIDVRLQTQLSSDTAQIEDRFEATTMADIYRGNDVLIPAGSVLRGVVRSVNKATRTDRRGEIGVSFDQVTVGGRTYPMRGTVTDTIKGEGIKGEAARIGAGSAIGGVIGGIIGGVKGAVIGVLIGGGGTIAATEGKDVTLPPGTILRVRLDTPPDIR